MSARCAWLVLLQLLLGIASPRLAWTELADSSCVACHENSERFSEAQIDRVRSFHAGVHAEVSLSCHDCHGGNPDPSVSEDVGAAMDPDFEANPYGGVPERSEIPSFCGSCHSDPLFMRRYRPGARIDQEREYWTSRHGIALLGGDERVATCTDCHGSHGIRRPSDRESAVHPTRVSQTCGGCHSDALRMADTKLSDGRPLPVDQEARWRQSVHARALFEKEDLSAPTCNDCHGNHGAVPPGLDSIAFVCGQCHPREATLFRNSPKREGFERHNEYLASVGEEGCGACHDAGSFRGEILQLRAFDECSICHGHHGVVSPTTALLSPLPEAPCYFCHEGPRPQQLVEPEDATQRYRTLRDALLASAEQMGLQGDARYDWLVEQAKLLPHHTVAEAGRNRPVLRREFGRLFEKFRIGKTHYSYEDPASGRPIEARLARCDDCHASREDASGLSVSSELLGRMQELSALTASAERILLRARRGGVETRGVIEEIDRSVDAEIKLEALVHSFQGGESSEFARQHAIGMAHASAAVSAGRQALGELASRRKGLALSLGVIGLVLVALALKIRSLPQSPPGGESAR